ncbi:YgcG family protein [Phenylobacterium sp.]|uniref:TPM domain-containing protein n=1 Tax=Phenylobacterium sp. TaxID=1871053 RepID=UPI0035AECBEF
MTFAPRMPAFGFAGRRRAWLVPILALAVAAVTAAGALAAPKFPPLTGRVVDDAKILSPATEERLTGELKALEDKTGHQMVVVTVPDLQGYPIEDYGYQLGRTWGIGDKDRDDGVLFLVAPSERKVRIEVGYGLEPVLTDALSSLILQRQVIPAFKAGDMEGGVVAGTEAVIAQLGLPEDQARAIAAQAAEQPATSDGGHFPVILIIIFVVLFLMGRGFGWWWLPFIFMGGGGGGGRHRGGGGWGGGGGGGGFSGGGGSFGGGGSSGSW